MIDEEMDDSGVGIGEAVGVMKDGGKVTRKGWNGKGMWLRLLNGGITDHGEVARGAVVMRTVDNEIVPWTCSQTDLLATDWEIVE